MSESVIDVSGLTRRFGAMTALDSVTVSMARGGVSRAERGRGVYGDGEGAVKGNDARLQVQLDCANR